MGNTQYCCNYKDKDPNAQEFGDSKKPGLQKGQYDELMI